MTARPGKTPSLIPILFTLVLSVRLDAADFYVAPQGDDQGSGSSDQPFATFQRAQEAVRKLRERSPQRRAPIIVEFRDGVYRLDEAIVLTPDDNGSPESPAIYQAAEGARPVLSGGVRLENWKVGDDGRWRLQLGDARNGAWRFTQIWVNDQLRYRPRLPQEGMCQIAGELPSSENAAGKGYDRFTFQGDDLKSDWTHFDDIELQLLHIWSDSRLGISSIDPATKTVNLRGRTGHLAVWMNLASGRRYIVHNVAKALSAPGQWYLNSEAGELTYIPRLGETLDNTAIVAPKLEQLLIVRGERQPQRRVAHIKFVGLTFAHAAWYMPPNGLSFPQAEVNVRAAVELSDAEQVEFEHCAVRHVGGYGVTFGVGTLRCSLNSCEIFDLGAGGVKIGTAASSKSWLPPDLLLVRDDSDEDGIVHDITVHDSTIANGGRLHPAAVGVWIGDAHHNRVTHNDIFDFYYTGVSVGWRWGYDASHAHHNEVNNNHIYKIGQGILSDMAGVYTLGVSPGTTVNNNHVHDVDAYDYGGWGLYTDEGSTGIVFQNNLVYRTKTGSFHQHYGRENRITNNIFAFAKVHQLQRTRAEPHLSFTLERNIVLWDNDSPLMGSNWGDNQFATDYNLYWHTGGADRVRFPGELTLDEWQKQRSKDVHSVVANPQFVDAKAGDFTLRPGSPAQRIGFKPFDWSKSGRLSEPTLTKDLPTPPPAFP